MKESIVVNAVMRGDMGKGASRRLRHADKVPGIVYGANKTPIAITVEHKELLELLEQESFYTQILDLDINGSKEQVILRDLQRHPFKPRVLHLDLQRINTTEKITMRIPFHFQGADVAPGVKISGGLVSHLISDVEVRCLPKDLPEFIEVDLSELEVNQTIHLSDLKLPEAVEILVLANDGEDQGVATIYVPRAVVEDTAAPVSAEVPVAGEEEKANETKADGGKPSSDKK